MEKELSDIIKSNEDFHKQLKLYAEEYIKTFFLKATEDEKYLAEAAFKAGYITRNKMLRPSIAG